MNVYQKRRVQNNIKKSDMARMLGLEYNYYCAIEKGEIKMPMNLIEKFSEIINRGKVNEIEELNYKMEANKFWEEMSAKDETGKYQLVNKMHEFNIKDYKELVNLLGYKSTGTVFNYLQGRSPAGDEFKKRLYQFFSDEKNVQIPKEPTKKYQRQVNYQLKETNPKLDKYYEKTNFRKILKENGITNKQIADVVGVHNSTISNMTCKKFKPSYKIIGAVKDYLDDYLAKTIPQEKAGTLNVSDEYISKTVLLDKCNDEIAKYQTAIEEYEKQIISLKSQLELTIKLVDMINKM